MKPLHRKALLAFSFLAVFVAGFFSATWLLFYDPLRRADFVMGFYSSIEQLDTYLYMSRMLGDANSYQAALSRYIEEIVKRSKQAGWELHSYAPQLAVAYARLGLLTEEQGKNQEANLLFTKAAKLCPVAFGHQCTTDRLRQLVATLDAQQGAPEGRSAGKPAPRP